jgi:hypothetical protein
MNTSAFVLRHSDTNCLPIGSTDEGKTQRKIEGWSKSMTVRGGGTERDAGGWSVGWRKTIVQWPEAG